MTKPAHTHWSGEPRNPIYFRMVSFDTPYWNTLIIFRRTHQRVAIQKSVFQYGVFLRHQVILGFYHLCYLHRLLIPETALIRWMFIVPNGVAFPIHTCCELLTTPTLSHTTDLMSIRVLRYPETFCLSAIRLLYSDTPTVDSDFSVTLLPSRPMSFISRAYLNLTTAKTSYHFPPFFAIATGAVDFFVFHSIQALYLNLDLLSTTLYLAIRV